MRGIALKSGALYKDTLKYKCKYAKERCGLLQDAPARAPTKRTQELGLGRDCSHPE